MVGWFIYAVCEPCLQALFINPASLTCDNLSSVLPIISGEVLAHNAGRPPRRKGHRGQHRAGLLHPGRLTLTWRPRRRTGKELRGRGECQEMIGDGRCLFLTFSKLGQKASWEHERSMHFLTVALMR